MSCLPNPTATGIAAAIGAFFIGWIIGAWRTKR